jgi:hypothetical protein
VSRYRALPLEKLEAALDRGLQGLPVLVAAELERLLGRFEAAEARLAGVAASRRLEQIRKHAQSRNSEPQVFAAE